MTIAAGTRFDHYEIRGLLGEGGMGEVYRARDTRLDRVVALKLLPAALTMDPDRIRRFIQESDNAGSPANALYQPCGLWNAMLDELTFIGE